MDVSWLYSYMHQKVTNLWESMGFSRLCRKCCASPKAFCRLSVRLIP